MTYPTLALYAELRSLPDATVARIDVALSTTWHTFTKRGRQLLLSDLDTLCDYVLHQQAHVNRADAMESVVHANVARVSFSRGRLDPPDLIVVDGSLAPFCTWGQLELVHGGQSRTSRRSSHRGEILHAFDRALIRTDPIHRLPSRSDRSFAVLRMIHCSDSTRTTCRTYDSSSPCRT